MKRRVDTGGRPPIPEHLRRFRTVDWLTERERTVGASDEAESARIGVRAYRRYRAARQAWGGENGYSPQELWKAGDE